MSRYNALNQWLTEVSEGHTRSISYKRTGIYIYANLLEDDICIATISCPKYPESSSENLRALSIINYTAGVCFTSLRPPNKEEVLYYSRSQRVEDPNKIPFHDTSSWIECPLCDAYYTTSQVHPSNNCSWIVDGDLISKSMLQTAMRKQREEGKI